MTRARELSLQGIALVIIATACFATLDTTTKWVSSAVPAVMALWFRYLFQSVVTMAALLPRCERSKLKTQHPWLQLARGALLLTSSFISFFSLQHLPLGEFTTIAMLAPLVITLLAARTLGEQVSLMRWLAVAGGFAGALLVIRPGSEAFTPAALLPVLLVVCLAGFQVLTSYLAKLEDAVTTHFYTGSIGAVLVSIPLPFFWQPLASWTLWAALLLMGLFATLGHFLLILGYARASAATLTPFLYAQIAFAALSSWIAFGHAPDAWSMAGIALIAACGVLGTWLTAREQPLQAVRTEQPSMAGGEPLL